MTEYAGFFSRFLAWLVDGVAMAFLSFIVAFIASACASLALGGDSDFLGFLSGITVFFLIVILLFFQFFYFGYYWSKNGQSIGMKLTNIRVVRRKEAETLSFWRAGFRGTLGYYISSLIFGLGYIWAALDGNKEAWHDKLFDTWVIKE